MSKKDIEDIYSLSPLQQGMLVHTLSTENSKLYFEQLNFTLRGEVDVPTLKRAWDKVAERHAILRTSFAWEGIKKPVQIVHRHKPLDWVELDWRNLDPTAQKIALVEYAQADRARGYDMSKAPLMRLALIRLADETYHFIWSYHHVLLDGWSISIIFGEALNFYQAFSKGQELNLPNPTPFRAYISHLSKQNLAEAETFWRSTLKNFLAPTPLPFDFVHANGDAPRFHTLHLSIERTTSAALQHLARQHQLTLNTIVQGAWALLLSRYSGNRDVVFGAAVSGRPAELPGVEAMVGLFINTLPVRVRLEEKQNVVQWLQQLQSDQLDARQYAYSPLAQVQGWSEMGRGHGLFDSFVAFENSPVSPSSSQSRQTKSEISAETNEQSSNYEKSTWSLTLGVVPGDEIFFQLTYNQRRFSEKTITRLLQHFQRVLEVFAAEPETTLGEVSLLSKAEKRQLLHDWNRTDAAEYQAECIHRLFEQQVEQTPDQIALEFGSERVSYRELNERANRLARYLRQQRVKLEVVVGLCLERSIEMVVAVLGVLKAGGAYLPLDPGYPLERLSFMLQETAVPLLLTQERLLDQLPGHWGEILCLDTEWTEREAEYDGANIANDVRPENLAYVIYTSGSTGRPKGVSVTHHGLKNLARVQQRAFGLRQDDRVMQFASLSFDASVSEIFVTLCAGATLCLPGPQEALVGETWVAEMERQAINVVTVPPSLLAVTEARQLGRLRNLIVAGEACSRKVAAAWSEKVERLIDAYGPSEASVCASINENVKRELDEGDGREPSIGKVIDHAALYIVDGKMQPVPVGVIGELFIGGVGLARGYWRRPELTAEKFVPHPFSERAGARLYRTGDLARYLADARVEFLGRSDQQVKLHGYRIELGEIEAVLRKQHGVQDAAVIVREERLVGYVVRADDTEEITMSEWRSRLSEQLPEYMIPAVVVELPELPLTANGKLDRKALPEPDGARPKLGSSYEAPRNEVEAELCRIWATVLGLERVGIHDNFFELGGDSILSIQIVARANQKGLRLAHKHLLEHRTVGELAAVVDTTPVIQNEQGEVVGEQRLTPIQHWFFAQQSTDLQHWNQATLVSVSGRLRPELLKAAIGVLLRQHDALRLRFRQDGESWKAHYAAVSNEAPLTVHDLSGVAEPRDEIERLATAAQSSLNLGDGPLLQAHYFDLGEQGGRLLLVIHHLAVDIVSWSILLDHLRNAYEQLEHGAKDVQLPHKTTSYQQWGEVLQEYAESLPLLAQVDYWLDDRRREVRSLPTDFSEGENLESTTRQLAVYLDAEETRKLVFEVSKAGNVQVNEVLLAVLAQTLSQWTGDKHVLVDVEGHGREETIGEVDLTRTVGWFTTIHPVLLTLEDNAAWDERLRTLTKQLRAVPKRGIGYGVLRYLSGKKEIVERLESLPQAEVLFNYGRFVEGEQERLEPRALRFGTAAESAGPALSARAKRTHLLEVNASIAGEQLCVRWSFSDHRHERATVEKLAHEFLNELQSLIDSFQASDVTTGAIPQLNDEAPFWAPLVPLQPRGSKAPFFCVHPAGGSVLPLVDLARQFSPDQPFYGLQAVGLYEEREPYTTIEEMAARYVDEIRSIQQEGPYVIGGLSFGGFVAFEIAQQLYKQNQTVSLLAILDTVAPSFDGELNKRTHDPDAVLFDQATAAAERVGKKLLLTLEEFRQLSLETKLEFVLDQLKPHFSKQLRRELKIYQYHGRAIRNYQPRVYPDRITLFRSSEMSDNKSFKNMYEHPSFADPAMGWGALSTEPVEIYRIPGHHTQIVTEPYVRVMAQHMRACLEKRKEKTKAALH